MDLKSRTLEGGDRRAVGIRGGRAARRPGARPGTWGRPGVRAAGSAGRWGQGSDSPGWARQGASSCLRGEAPGPGVAEVAQAAGLGLGSSFSIRVPAQGRAGAGPRPEQRRRARGGVGEGAILGPRRPSAGALPAAPCRSEPRALTPRRPPLRPGGSPIGAAQHPPTPAQPGTTLLGTPDSPCAPRRHSPHRRGAPAPRPRLEREPRGSGAQAAAARGGWRRPPAPLSRQHSLTSWW